MHIISTSVERGEIELFYFGLLLLILGALAGYLNEPIARVFRLTAPQQALWVKVAGLVFVVLGVILLVTSEFPGELQFLRVIEF